MPSFPGHLNPSVTCVLCHTYSPLTSEQDTFDLIHIRNLDQGIINSNWPKVLAEAYRYAYRSSSVDYTFHS